MKSKFAGGTGMLRSRKGFTLVELLISMSVFIIVIMITTQAFNTILTQMAKITKSEESNIEGILGLEMFRHDITQIGYGLPYSYMDQTDSSYPKPTYAEALSAPASTYNDAPNGIPRSIAAGNNLAASSLSDGTNTYNILANTDYLALKATSLGLNDAAKKWTYVRYSSSNIKPHIWPAGNLVHSDDLVIVLRRLFNGSEYVNQMVYNTGTTPASIYWARYYSDGFADLAFNPTQPQDVYYLYGIKTGGTTSLRMPFNRADYFVATPAAIGKQPTFCAENTGVLYKGVVNHADGRLTHIPMLDCVADMQVVFGWDIVDGMGNEGQDGRIDTYSTPEGITVSPSGTVGTKSYQDYVKEVLLDPEKIRKGLKIIKIYVLAQVGRSDKNYQSAASFAVGDPVVDLSISKTYNLTTAMRNYHWKVYRIAVRPKNMLTNK